MRTLCFVDEGGNALDESLVSNVEGGGALLTVDGVLVDVLLNGIRVELLFIEPVHCSLDDTQWNTL